MKKKGFTLVELLAVIVILAIILAVAVPGISGIVKSSTMSSMQSDAKLVLKSIDLKKLEDSSFDPLAYNSDMPGLLSALKLNGDNYQSINLSMNNNELLIRVKGKGKWAGLTACGSYHNMNVTEAACEFDSIVPVITLLGDAIITIDKGDTYVDAGATALDNKDGDITASIVTTNPVDVNVAGTYTITYDVSDSSGNPATQVTRTVNVLNDLTLAYGGSGSEAFNAFIKTADGYVAVGYSASTDGDLSGLSKGAYDGMIVKYDISGNTIWKKNYGGTNDERFYSVVEANDGYIVVGESRSTDGDLSGLSKGSNDAIIVKYDTNGNVVWKKNYGGTNQDFFYSVAKVSDGYIAVGSSSSTDGDSSGINKGSIDAIIVKYNTSGTVVWKKNYGGTMYEFFRSIIEVSDGYVAVGESNSTDVDLSGLSKGDYDGIIVKYNTSGTVVWKKNYGGSGADYFKSLSAVSDGYVAVGYSPSTSGDLTGLNKGGTDAIIVKYNTSGTVIWKKNYGGSGNDIFSSITNLNDGLLTVGYSASTDGDSSGLSKGGNDATIVKYDANGTVVWKKHFGGSASDIFNSVVAKSNGYIAAGYSASTDGDLTGLNKGGTDSILIKR